MEKRRLGKKINTKFGLKVGQLDKNGKLSDWRLRETKRVYKTQHKKCEKAKNNRELHFREFSAPSLKNGLWIRP